jgi:hypothetical protein
MAPPEMLTVHEAVIAKNFLSLLYGQNMVLDACRDSVEELLKLPVGPDLIQRLYKNNPLILAAAIAGGIRLQERFAHPEISLGLRSFLDQPDGADQNLEPDWQQLESLVEFFGYSPY